MKLIHIKNNSTSINLLKKLFSFRNLIKDTSSKLTFDSWKCEDFYRCSNYFISFDFFNDFDYNQS